MKLTADMFDFEKYDYFDCLTVADGGERLDRSCGFPGVWVPISETHYGLCRKPKPPPRYILLNEGEKPQSGDQRLMMDPRMWSAPLEDDGYSQILPGEVWRRKAP